MTISRPSRSFSSLLLGATLVAGVGAGCGVEVRPRLPTLQAHAVVAPASFSAEPAPAYESSPGYVAPAAEPGPAPMPDDVATAGQYVQSGGATPATAEVVAVGSTLLGRVAKGAPRYYAMDLAAGDSLHVKAYTRVTSGSSGNFSLIVIEPDEVKLRELYTATYSETEWDRETMNTAAKQTGRHLIRVTTNNASMEYKVTISGEVQAAQ